MTAKEKQGILDANRLYSTRALREIGFGRQTLTEARKSGVVRPYLVGRNHWYEGRELIEWIRQHGRQLEGANR